MFTLLSWLTDDQSNSGDNRASSPGCTMNWCCVLAGFYCTQYQGAYTDPAHQLLLVIFYEEKAQLKCQRMGMAKHQIKTKLHIESFVKPVSSQTRKALVEKRVCGQHSNITSTKHFWHFCSILSLKCHSFVAPT